MAVETQQTVFPARRWRSRFGDSRNMLGLIFMLPAGLVLLVFLDLSAGPWASGSA